MCVCGEGIHFLNLTLVACLPVWYWAVSLYTLHYGNDNSIFEVLVNLALSCSSKISHILLLLILKIPNKPSFSS